MTPPAILGLNASELVIPFVLVLVIFGAGKLPQIGASLGKSIRNFRKSVRSDDDGVEEEEEKKKN